MSDHVVIDHHHDREAGLYRLTIGVPVIEDRPVLDKDGQPKTHKDGTPVLEEVIAGHDQVRDFVFADDDERWKKKSDKRVAQLQRKAVAAAVKKEQEAQPPARAVHDLPGIGGGL